MNIEQFAKLKVGDKVQNLALGSGVGEVVKVAEGGITVRWPPSEREFYYSVQGTAWFQWSVVDPVVDAGRAS